MKKLLLIIAFAIPVFANQGVGGFCEQGNIAALTSGLPSTNVFQGSFPSCTVSVFTAGTTNLITIFADNINTPLSNPFTANTSGRWLFYSANNQRVDIQLSGGGLPSPWKINDVILNDPNGGVVVPSNFAGIRIVDGVTFASSATGINAADANLGATMGEVWIPSGALTATDAQISIRAGHTLRIFGQVTIDALNKGPVLLGGTSKIACSGNYGAANILNVSAQAIPSMVRLTTQDGSLGSMAIEGCRIDANGSTVTNGIIDASGATGGPSYVRENFITGLASGWGVFIQDIQSGALAGTNNVQIINNRILASGTGACIEILHSATNTVTINSIDILDNSCAPGATSTTSVLIQNTDTTSSHLRQINIANLTVTTTPTGQSSVSLNGVQQAAVKGLSCITGTNCLLIANNANNAVIAVDSILTYSGNNVLNDAAAAITIATSAIHYDFQGATTTQAQYRVNSTLSGNNTFSGTNTLSGPLVITGTDTGTQTISGNKTFSGTNILSGPLSVTGTDSGTQTISGNKTFSGTNAFSSTDTFTGVNTFTQLSGCQHVNASQSFAAALAVGGVTCIIIDPGTWPVSASATIPSSVTLAPAQGGVLQISCGQKLTVSGPFQAGLYQTFSSAACSGAQSASITAATQNPASTVAITAASESGNTVTITTTLNPGVANLVQIAGVTPAGYNETCYVITSSGTTFTCYNPTSGLGAGTVFGTAGVATNTATITSTLNPAVGSLVQVAGVTPGGYNGIFYVLTSTASNFTIYDSQTGLAAGSVFGTATSPGTTVFTFPGNESFARPEWWGAVADGTTATPVTGTDNYPAFVYAMNALPVFLVSNQGPYSLPNGMSARTGTIKFSLGRYVISQTWQISEAVMYDCPAYRGCQIYLKNGVASSGNEMWMATVITNPLGGNSTYGAQFRNLYFDCQGGYFYGTNTSSSGLIYASAQGGAIGTIWLENCGQRGIWMNTQGVGNVNPGADPNGPNDIEVLGITQGPGVQMDVGPSAYNSIRAEHIGDVGTFLDSDGDNQAGILIGSPFSNGAENVNIVAVGIEFDGLPIKVWGGNGIALGSGIYIAKSGGQPTALLITHSAAGVLIGSMQSFASAPNLFTNFIVDRTQSPTVNISGNFSNFPVSLAHLGGAGFGNVGSYVLNHVVYPEFSSAPSNIARAGFDACYADATHAIKCSYNNSAFGPLVTAAPCTTSQKTETAADANLLTCAIPAQAGSYRMRFVLDVSAANAATLGWTATWTDSNGIGVTPTNMPLFQQNNATSALTWVLSSSTDLYGYADIDVNNAGTSIVVKLTFSGTSFTAKASATVERII